MRRTLRVVLWGGEEQGLLGSRAYVQEHYGDPATMVLKPDHAKVAAYFNSDNGTGRVRGVWLQATSRCGRSSGSGWSRSPTSGSSGSGRARWGRRTTCRSTTPGCQASSSWWTGWSTTRARTIPTWMSSTGCSGDEMVQHATVAAVFAYNAAMRAEMLPRKALPKVPAKKGK